MYIVNLAKKFSLKKMGLGVVTATVQFCCTLALLLSGSIVILSLSKDASAATIQLPQTGQIKCFAVAGELIDCESTGQDGDQMVGVSPPSPRFTVYATDCMTDNLTGLMWVKAPSTATRKINWASTEPITASVYANDLVLCEYSDWRLPNINELESLVNLNNENPAAWLNAQGFSNVQSDCYWSSSTYAGNTGNAWRVNMSNGDVSNYLKTGYCRVWSVRGGQ